jgi:DNA-binding winged helix-turn-helix (wHTH) protein
MLGEWLCAEGFCYGRGAQKQPGCTTSSIRFGPYELDLRSAELRKNEVRIRLQEQPFQILVALLERPGEVVLREEIRNRLWPDDTVVEFDHGINAAVKRLRDALCESVDKPRYIETLARKGYRFIRLGSGSPPMGTPTRLRRMLSRTRHWCCHPHSCSRCGSVHVSRAG